MRDIARLMTYGRATARNFAFTPKKPIAFESVSPQRLSAAPLCAALAVPPSWPCRHREPARWREAAPSRVARRERRAGEKPFEFPIRCDILMTLARGKDFGQTEVHVHGGALQDVTD